MPSARAPRDDFLAAAEHIRKLMAITDEIDELIPCGWLSSEEAAKLRAIPDFLFRCVLDESPLVLMLRDSIASLVTIFEEPKVAAVIWENDRIVAAEKRSSKRRRPRTSRSSRLRSAISTFCSTSSVRSTRATSARNSSSATTKTLPTR